MNKLLWYSPNALDGESEYFNYKDGITYRDNLSEQLDSMTIVIPFQTRRIKFEPFDHVYVFNDNFERKYFLIDSIDEQQISFDPDMFEYTLTLMSRTKSLERIVLPNISVTKSLENTNYIKTINQILNNLIDDYSPKKWIDGTYQKIYSIKQESFYVDNECPEIQMSKPTLREALDKLYSMNNCIAQVDDNGEISGFNINQKNNPIVLENLPELNYHNSNQSSSDYASGLENTYNNVVPNKGNNIKNYTTITEYIGFRNQSGGVVNYSNMSIVTTKPIYLIKKVYLCGAVGLPTSSGQPNMWDYIEKDITNYINEKNVWDTMTYEEKLYGLYYVRGGSEILGFSDSKLFWLLKQFGLNQLLIKLGYFGIATSNDVGDFIFKVEYYAQDENVRAASSKYLPETNEDNFIIDNPSDAYVDIKQQGRLFNQKVNRLGNRVKQLYGRFPISRKNYIPQLGDYLDNFIVMNRQLEYYDDFIVVNLILTENFININYFTGINARKRSWQLVSAGEAFNKELLDKIYCEFSFQEKERVADDFNLLGSSINLSRYLLDEFNYINNSCVSHVIFKSNFYGGDSFYYELDLSSYISGNSLIFSFEASDNYTIGRSLGSYDEGSNTDPWDGYRVQNFNPYVDSNGEALSYEVFILNSKFNVSYEGVDISLLRDGTPLYNPGETAANAQWQSLKTLGLYRPRVMINNFSTLRSNCLLYNCEIFNHKDNREKIGFNIQFEFCSDTPNIVVGRAFLENNNAVKLSNNFGPFKIIGIIDDETEFNQAKNQYKQLWIQQGNQLIRVSSWSDSYRGLNFFRYGLKYYIGYEKYRYGDNELKGTNIEVTANNFYIDPISGSSQASSGLEFGHQEQDENQQSVIITNENDEILLAINTDRDRFNIYLNLLRTRDTKNYIDTSLDGWDTN